MDKFKNITFKHVVGAIVMVVFCLITVALIFHEVPVGNKEVLHIVIGEIVGAAIMIVGYYYGSSSGSKEKTDMLGKEMDKKYEK